MNLYRELAAIPAFNLNDVSSIVGSKTLASKKINSLLNDGSVHKIKRNMYTCVNFGTLDDYANRFEIASKITEDSFICFHSAFEFYGYYNQVYYDVHVCSSKRFSEFDYDDYRYKSYQTDFFTQVDVIQGIRVTSIERTIVDSINMLGKVLDAEELVKCLDLVVSVNENKLLEVLDSYDKEILYRKVGYVLSFYKEEFSLSKDFFLQCKSKGTMSNKGYLILKEKDFLTFNSEWGLYAYKDMKRLVFKGGEMDI